MNHSNYKPDFLDPYAVEGAERAKRFAHNFNAEEHNGVSGVLQRWTIIMDAELNLPPQHMKIFCDEIGHEQGSECYEIMRAAAVRYQQWQSIFRTTSGEMAIFNLMIMPQKKFEVHIEVSRGFLQISGADENLSSQPHVRTIH